MPVALPATPPPAWRDGLHLRVALSVFMAVLLMHALLLGLWPRLPGPGAQAHKPRPLLTRQIVRQSVSRELTQPGAAVQPPAAATAKVQRPARQKQDVMAPVATLPAAVSQPPVEAIADASTLNTNTTPEPEPGADSVPTFATLPPPPFTLQYRLQRGLVSARATLRWQLSEGTYNLSLQTSAFGAKALAWNSDGAIDAHGLAPLRYAEGRRGREQRAVNFQREAGLVTFSGPQLQYPLVPGMQDRISWALQLSAIVSANPQLVQAGAQVPMFVVGARGDAQVWTFTVLDIGPLDLPSGVVPMALHLKREPRRAYDAQTEVWLDPARHHLPVRMRLLVQATGEGTDFVMEELSLP